MTGEEAQAEAEERQNRERQEQEQRERQQQQQQQQQANNNLTDQQVVSIIVDNVFPNGPPQAGPSQQHQHRPPSHPVHPQYYAMAYPIPPPPVLGADPMHQHHHPHAFPHHPQGYVLHAHHHPQPTHVWHITPHPMMHHPNAPAPAHPQMGSGVPQAQPSWVAYSAPEAMQQGAYGQPPGGEYRYREVNAPQWMNPPASTPQAQPAPTPTTQPYYEPQVSSTCQLWDVARKLTMRR